MVSLRPLTDVNRREVLALRVAPSQQGFVSSVVDSLREAARIEFYERYGFERTGAVHGGEVVLQLRLR